MRIGSLKRTIRKLGLEGYIVTKGTSILYFTGFRFVDFMDGTGLVVPASGRATLLVSRLDAEEAKKEARDCDVEVVERSLEQWKALSSVLSEQKMKSVGFDYLDASVYLRLKKKFDLSPNSNAIWDLRKIKDEVEIAKIRKAARIADSGMRVAEEVISPGLREYEVAAEIEYAMRKRGSQGTAFETIVASGVRSALPHGWSTEKSLGSGELVVVDIGSIYEGYRSDLTRTFVVGKPTDRQAKLYQIVEEAQRRALSTMRQDIRCCEVDGVARDFIQKSGYGKHFIHGLGHGIGLDFHEPPRLSKDSRDILRAGNVITNEPGIYVSAFGGVRIEDTVLITDDGAENLTRIHKRLSA